MPDAEQLSHVLLEWAIMPPDFFLGQQAPALRGYVLTFEDGKVSAQIEAATWSVEPSIQQRIQRELEGMLYVVAMHRQRVPSLTGPDKIEVERGGRRTHYVEVRDTVTMSDTVTWRLIDANGNVVRDSVEEQREAERALMERVSVHADDATLRRLLQSYRAAQVDAANELVYLYEIIDALGVRFGGEHKARQRLGVIKADWSTLGELANNAPVRQGRHRGKMKQLRDATSDELNECRRVAKTFILAYLDWLTRSGAPQCVSSGNPNFS